MSPYKIFHLLSELLNLLSLSFDKFLLILKNLLRAFLILSALFNFVMHLKNIEESQSVLDFGDDVFVLQIFVLRVLLFDLVGGVIHHIGGDDDWGQGEGYGGHQRIHASDRWERIYEAHILDFYFLHLLTKLQVDVKSASDIQVGT